jgi:DNA-binding PucR family transcriptional regulator
MDETLPWYRAMSAADRSWVGLVAQAGIAAFVAWFRDPEGSPEVTADVFGTAPRELARAITLQQTVEMVRTTITVVEEQIAEFAAADEHAVLTEAVLRYSREVAFAAAQVYAQAAEARGAWDARLEALVIDALLRGEVDPSVASRAAALGWGAKGSVLVMVGRSPDEAPDVVADNVQRAARHEGVDVISGVQGDRLIVVIGGAADPSHSAQAMVGEFGPGPVVLGPVVPDLASAARSAEAAVAGLTAAAAWPMAPRPVDADDLLPERALAGDGNARKRLVQEVYRPLCSGTTDLIETVSAYLEQSGSLEGAARVLFVHPNTVRYRLRRIAEISGQAPTEPRGAFSLRVALALGRLEETTHLL